MAQLSDLLREIRDVRKSVNKVENIVERRLIGLEEPSKDELQAITEYDNLKSRHAARYVPLEEALKSHGGKRRIRSTSRKASC